MIRDAEALTDEFQRCRKWIDEALAQSGADVVYKSRDVLDFLLTDRALLWSDTRAAIVTTIHVYPRGRVCTVWLAGGEDLDAILAFWPAIREYAQEMGCRAVEVDGRPAWTRKLSALGFSSRRVVMMTEIGAAA